MTKTHSTKGDALRCLDHDMILARILDTGLVGVLLVSLDGKIVFANEVCCKMVGCDSADLVTRRFAELVHPDDQEASRHDLAVVTMSEAGKLDFERRFVRRDGLAAWAKGSASLLRDKEADEPLVSPLAGPVHQFGIGRERDRFLLYGGVDNHRGEVRRFGRFEPNRRRQALLH